MGNFKVSFSMLLSKTLELYFFHKKMGQNLSKNVFPNFRCKCVSLKMCFQTLSVEVGTKDEQDLTRRGFSLFSA